MTTRKAAVAGKYYPNDPQQLNEQVAQLLAAAKLPVEDAVAGSLDSLQDSARAIVAPHAGYMFSGSVAASAYKSTENHKEEIHRVVVLGPSHHVSFVGLALPEDDYFSTPLGDLRVDQDACTNLLEFPFVHHNRGAHQWEHSIEVQLPFLQKMYENFSIVPIVVGNASPEQVSDVINHFWNDEHTLVVISSDLSHYHSYEETQQIDQATTQAIEAKDYHLQGKQACGCRPLNGLLKLAFDKNLTVTNIDLKNSGDSGGDHAHVVGYGAYIVH